MSKKLLFVAGVGMGLMVLVGCGSNRTPKTASEEPALVIPAECPLAKIKEGMSQKQVFDLIGAPTDQRTYTTGKQFNPVYYGTDYYRHELYYKGMGRVTLNSRQRVIRVAYDPAEDGYGTRH